MKSLYSVKTRNLISTWLSAIFCCLLVMFLGFVEFFQDSKFDNTPLDISKSPITTNFLKDITHLKIKNRIGEFTIQKENKHWFLKEPRSMPAKESTLNLIRSSLESIKIITIHKNDPINFQSFSLDNPSITINMKTEKQEKTLKVGLINSIDNTSFLVLENDNKIYQTGILQGDLQSLELPDFIDTRIFSPTTNNLVKLKIYQGKNISPLHTITNNNGFWKFQKYNTISNDRVTKRVEKLLATQPHMIIDKNNEELKNVIENYLKNPNYKIEIETNKGEIIKYQISYPIKSISDLKIENKQYFLIKASNRKYPFLVNKIFLENFYIRYSEIRP